MQYPRPAFELKMVGTEALGDALARLRRPLVFTNGCFDVLHRGHVTYLAQARALGESLIVAVNSDDSVRRQGKGADRPINLLADRMAVLAALESVSCVVAFEEDTPLELIKKIHPDVLVKGGDWLVDTMVGASEVRGWGGDAYAIPFTYERSTTGLLAKIRG